MAQQRASGPTHFAINLTFVLLILIGIFATLFIGNAVVGAVSGGHEVPVHQEVSPDDIDSLPPSVIPADPVPVTIRVEDASPSQILLATARDLLVVALGGAILWLIRKVLLSVREGDPFTSKNVARIRTVGFLLVLGFPVVVFVGQLLEGWLASTTAVGELGNAFSLDLSGPLVAGLGVFVLAEVFAHGVRLREDVEGTV